MQLLYIYSRDLQDHGYNAYIINLSRIFVLLNLPILLIWVLPLYYAFLSVLTEPLTNFKEFSVLLRLLKQYHGCLRNCKPIMLV
jgi:hypothetical protein